RVACAHHRPAKQSNEQHAILSSMREGVIATDNEDKILILNNAAEEILGISIQNSRGLTIHEAIRNSNLLSFFEQSRESEDVTKAEFTLESDTSKIVQLKGTVLNDVDGQRIGMMVVLNDVTEQRRLENMRKDFVANVSHELKTPITSIKGFVETLRDGAIKDEAKAQEFLDIVCRQADRLNAIIEDLLALSQIEKDSQDTYISFYEHPLDKVIHAAVINCKQKALDLNVDISAECSEDIIIKMNPPLIEQAITNLIDNAVKYSPGGNVWVYCQTIGNEVEISIKDNGCGIESEHIPRLFERFYRVDKARSRKMGGTGLGLAIVKHIVATHDGRIEVESKPMQGSVFTIYLPIR
ncbi:MAG: ATP-binding protein, partial [Armatimonadota bacterium]